MADNPLEGDPKSRLDTGGDLDEYKKFLHEQKPQKQQTVSEGLSPAKKIDREAIAKDEADELQELHIAAEKAFNPDPPIEKGVGDAAVKNDARRIEARAVSERKKAAKEANVIASKQTEQVSRSKRKSKQRPEVSKEDSGVTLVGTSENPDTGEDLDAMGKKIQETARVNARGAQLEQSRQNRARAEQVRQNKVAAEAGLDQGIGELDSTAKQKVSEQETQRKLANESRANMEINLTEGAGQGISLTGLGNQIEAKQINEINARGAQLEQGRQNRLRADMVAKNKTLAEIGFDETAQGYQAATESRTIAQEQLRKTVAEERARQAKVAEQTVAQNKAKAESGIDQMVGEIVSDQDREKSARGQIEAVSNRLRTKANEARSAEHVGRKEKKDAAFGEVLNEVGEKAMYAQIAQREKDRQRRASTSVKNEERISAEAEKMTDVLAEDEANEQFQQNISEGLKAKAQEKSMNDEGATEADRLVQEGLATDVAAAEAAKQAKAEQDQKEMDERFAGLRATDVQQAKDKIMNDRGATEAGRLVQEGLASDENELNAGYDAAVKEMNAEKLAGNKEFLQSISVTQGNVKPTETGPVLSHEQIAGWNKDFNDNKAAEAAKQNSMQGKSFARRAGEFVGRIGRFFGGGVKQEQAKIIERAKSPSPELNDFLNRISGQGAVEAPAEAIILPDESVTENPAVVEVPVPVRNKEAAPVVENKEEVYDLKEKDLIKEPEAVAEAAIEQPVEKKLVKAERLPEKAESEKKLSNGEKLSLLNKLKEKWDELREVSREIKKVLKEFKMKNEDDIVLLKKNERKKLEESLSSLHKTKRRVSAEIISIAENISKKNLKSEAVGYTEVEIDGEKLNKVEKEKLINDSLTADVIEIYEKEMAKIKKVKRPEKRLVTAERLPAKKLKGENPLKLVDLNLPKATKLAGKDMLEVSLPRPVRAKKIPQTVEQTAA